MKLLKLTLSILFLLQLSCAENDNIEYKELLNDPELFQEVMQNLTNIIVNDIFSPPVASRVYLYPSIAAYEIISSQNPEKFTSLVGQIKELKEIPKTNNPYVDAKLASIYAFNSVAKTLIFSENKMISFQKKFQLKIKNLGVPEKVMLASETYANKVVEEILDWSKKDMYSQTRTFPKYTIMEEDQYWKPTPPDYMDGIEPHWQEIRTMVLDSSNQFPPKEPLALDLKKGSPFQKQLMDIFELTNTLTQEQVDIAKFWDCNPYVTHHKGHSMFATKKITPGGHWIGITAIATGQVKSSFEETINAYANVSIALFDALLVVGMKSGEP